MRVRIMVRFRATDCAYEPGQVADLPDSVAHSLMRHGWAEMIGPPESAALAAPENAMLPRPATRTGA